MIASLSKFDGQSETLQSNQAAGYGYPASHYANGSGDAVQYVTAHEWQNLMVTYGSCTPSSRHGRSSDS